MTDRHTIICAEIIGDGLKIAADLPFEPSFTRFDGSYTTTWLNNSIPFQLAYIPLRTKSHL